MKLSELKSVLGQLDVLDFQLPNGTLVPSHFHITEVGKISKQYIDCGGTLRSETLINLQLWNANDVQHRLSTKKLLDIITLSEKILNIEDLEIEVEHQGHTIEKYGLDFDGENFLLTTKKTDCLAQDKCGVPSQKPKIKLSDLGDQPCCTPDGNCC